jgi:oligosaccharide repeat unit polymerase
MQVLRDSKSKNFGRDFLLYTQIVCALFFGLLLPALVDPFKADDFVPLLCILVAVVTIWTLWSWHAMTGSWFDPYTLFFTAAVVFNAGQALLEIFGLNNDGMLKGRFPPETLVRTLLLVLLGLTAFHLGGMLAAARRKNRSQLEDNELEANITGQAIRFVGWGLLAISVIPSLILTNDAISLVMMRGYFALFQRDSGVGLNATPQVLGAFLVPSALFLLAGAQKHRTTRLVSLLIILFYCIIQLFLGHRNTAYPVLLAYLWLWHRVVRPLPRLFIVVIAVGLLLISPLIAAIRDVPGQDRLSWNYLIERYSLIENPIVAAISEIGGSMSTIAYTLQLVPSTRDFDNGIDYLYATFTVVPNFLWELHPTIMRGTPSTWLIWHVNPFTAERGGTIGYSFIAEAYFNFGWIGTPIVLGIIGYLFARFVLWAQQSGKPERLAALASFTAFFLFFVRDEAATIFRPLIWYALVPYLAIGFIVPNIRSRTEAARGIHTSKHSPAG